MPTPRDICSNCGGAAHEIKLVDRSDYNVQSDAQYTWPEDKPRWWKGGRPIRGDIVAYMCEACGRIAHFGVPKEE
jgi:hypothetical protein